MPISGPVVHQQLMSAYSEAHQRLENARGQITHGQKVREDLEDSRSDAMVQLAEYYLPELTRDAIQNTWREIRATLSEILARKEQHSARLHEDVDGLFARRETQERELIQINERLDAARESQDKVVQQVETELQSDPEFVSLSDRAAVAEAALERAEDNLQEIDQDSARKLPAYDDSDLFTYLRDRKFGTPEYEHRGFTRRMDRWLAKMIGYQKAKQGYEFLRKTPEAMRKIIADDRAALETVMTELERLRDVAADRMGLPEKIQAVATINHERSAHLQSLEDLSKSIETVEHELTDLEGARGQYHREAITVFRRYLEQSDTRELRQRARDTRSVTDDQIVGRLLGIDAEIDDLEDSAKDRRRHIRSQQEVMDGLGRLIQRFRAAGFDAGRCHFVGSLDVLGELARADDERDVEEIWSDIRRAQRWGPSTMEKITNVATHPMTQVLINAMAHAAGAAMSGHARRAGRRRRSRQSPWVSGPWDFDSSGDLFGRRR